MKSKINKYFFIEFSRYFIVVLFSVISIVWIAQAVNYLDLIIEDGHALSVYFSYSLLVLPKIVTRLIPLCFLIAVVLTILKLEKDNELIVLWTSGLNKIRIVNLIVGISILIMCIQLFLANTISPLTLNLSRSILKNSSLDFFPALIKEKQFNDVIEDVTFFVEKKSSNGTFENIFIRDHNKILNDSNTKSSSIFAKSGFIQQNETSRYLVLYNGSIQKENESGQINFLKFDKTVLNIADLSGKTITQVKIQENSSLRLLLCVVGYDYYSSLKIVEYIPNYFNSYFKNVVLNDDHNCDAGNKDIIIELNRRFGMPLYIPTIALVASFLLTSSNKNKYTKLYKFIFFLLGFFILILAEISTRYSGEENYGILYYLAPFFLIPIIYAFLIRNFKYENV
jgi:lipopolysaccharide export system permease protein